MFILWAHMSSVHTELDTDKRSNLYCVKCDRSLSKRTKLLNHLDKCMAKNKLIIGPTNPPIEKFSCQLCSQNLTSLSHLETHLWDHATTQPNNS